MYMKKHVNKFYMYNRRSLLSEGLYLHGSVTLIRLFPLELDNLRRSDLVKRIVSVNFVGVGDSYRLKIRIEPKNGMLMDLWEHKPPS